MAGTAPWGGAGSDFVLSLILVISVTEPRTNDPVSGGDGATRPGATASSSTGDQAVSTPPGRQPPSSSVSEAGQGPDVGSSAESPGAGEQAGGDQRRGRPPRPRRPRRRGRGRGSGGQGGGPQRIQLPTDPAELEAMSKPLGLLELVGGGTGFVRLREAGYATSPKDVYVSRFMVQRFGLRPGDEIAGIVGQPRGAKNPPLAHLQRVNDLTPEEVRDRPEFDKLSAMHPNEQLVLECGRSVRGQPDHTNRVIDLLCPFGKGQRAMIVAPAKAGKTTVLQAVAEGIVTNHPEVHLLILLVDERPEEVTEIEQAGFGEVIASTFDRKAERHAQVSEITLERARRRVELGEDVVIILDSITRMARAYNTLAGGNQRTLSGGLGANALEKPKRFLGSARRISPAQGGGSLTIVATALVDTGSRMDQVIFEEFKGTGNSELVLSREIADRRIFPAIDLSASATRKEELLLNDRTLAISHAMRNRFSGLHPVESMQEVLSGLRKTETNDALVQWVQGL